MWAIKGGYIQLKVTGVVMVKSVDKDKKTASAKKEKGLPVAEKLKVDPPRETARREMLRLKQQIKQDD